MRLTFYGVRGSIPTPGAAFVRYGGNTACVHIELEDGTDIILDSGTGIRLLGERLVQKNTPIHLLLSHNHWDHIQGFPFFAPIYQASREINIYPGQTLLDEPQMCIRDRAMEALIALKLMVQKLPISLTMNFTPLIKKKPTLSTSQNLRKMQTCSFMMHSTCYLICQRRTDGGIRWQKRL